MAPDIFDMHCHLAFWDNAAAGAACMEQAGAGGFCATVTPAEFEAARAALAGAANVRVGVGLHPWWLCDGRASEADAARAAELAGACRYVGEVGLDFAHGRDKQAPLQVEALDKILSACEDGGHVLTVHAVASATAVLDLLERHRTTEGNDVVLHWFSGSGEELTRARKLGCLFSVNAFGLETRRGRAYARQIPAEQLLLETDLPGEGAHAVEWGPERIARRLRETLATICELRGEDASEKIAATSRRLLEL